MSSGVLTGFHGKLPVAGDFLTRGLPTGFSAFWDAWAARHLGGRANWPDGGLRLRLESGGKAACGVAIPGADRVGRRFPLAGFVIAPSLRGPAGLEFWCDAALRLLQRAQSERYDPDALAAALQAVPPPVGKGTGPVMALWTMGKGAQECDPSQPSPTLDAIFSCSGSSIPSP